MKSTSISSSFVIVAITIIVSILLLLNVAGVVSAATEVVEYYDKSTCDPGPHDVPNPSPEADAISPDLWYFVIPTTVNDDVDVDNNDADNGMITILVNRTWAPIGADRFYSLVKDNYYNCAAFFRVIPDFIIQWGIAANPNETEKWSTSIQDDPGIGISNTVGTVTFAKTSAPNSRTTQIFVNYVDNSFLDNQGFVPFGKVVKGMDILTTTGVGMYEPNPVPDQNVYRMNGNEWILENYPDIDIIKGSKISSASISEVTYNMTNDDENDSNDNKTNNEIMDDDDNDSFNLNETSSSSSSSSSSSEIIGSLDNILDFTFTLTGKEDDTTNHATASESESSAGNALTAITTSKTIYYYYGTTVTFFFFFFFFFSTVMF